MAVNITEHDRIKKDLTNIIVFSKSDGILEPPDEDSINWYIDNITFIESLIGKIKNGEEAVFYRSATDEYNELHLKIRQNKVYVTDIWGNTLVRGMLIKDDDVNDTKRYIPENQIGMIISLSIYHNEKIVQAMPQETIEEYQSRWSLIIDVILSVCFHFIRVGCLYHYDEELVNEIENIKNFKALPPTENTSKIKVFTKEDGKKKEIRNYVKEKYEHHISYEKILREMMIEDKRRVVFSRPDKEIELTMYLCCNIIHLRRKIRGYDANIMITVNATKQILVIENNNLDNIIKKVFGSDDAVMKEYDQIKRKAINIGVYYLLQYEGQRKKKDLAKDYGICIVGGPEPWQNRIEEMIPDIKILKNEHFGEFNLKYSSILVINTDHTGHSITQKAKETAKKYGCIIVYVNGSNLQIMLDEINNAMKD